jgi:hypothetical protein
MVFAAKKPTTQNSIEFKGFDIPIKNIEKESFNQPIFGCNNLSGVVQPVSCASVPSPCD